MTRCESAGLGWTKLHIFLDEYTSYLSRSLHYNHGYNHGYNHTSWFLGIWFLGMGFTVKRGELPIRWGHPQKRRPLWVVAGAGRGNLDCERGGLHGEEMTVWYVWHAIWRCKMDLYGFVCSESWICWINCEFGEQLTLAWSDLIQDRQLSLPFWTARLTRGFDQV